MNDHDVKDSSKNNFMNRRFQKTHLRNIFPSGFQGSASSSVDLKTNLKEPRSYDQYDKTNSMTSSIISDEYSTLPYSLTSWTRGESISEQLIENDGSILDSYAEVAGKFQNISSLKNSKYKKNNKLIVYELQLGHSLPALLNNLSSKNSFGKMNKSYFPGANSPYSTSPNISKSKKEFADDSTTLSPKSNTNFEEYINASEMSETWEKKHPVGTNKLSSDFAPLLSSINLVESNKKEGLINPPKVFNESLTVEIISSDDIENILEFEKNNSSKKLILNMHSDFSLFNLKKLIKKTVNRNSKTLSAIRKNPEELESIPKKIWSGEIKYYDPLNQVWKKINNSIDWGQIKLYFIENSLVLLMCYILEDYTPVITKPVREMFGPSKPIFSPHLTHGKQRLNIFYTLPQNNVLTNYQDLNKIRQAKQNEVASNLEHKMFPSKW